MRACSFRKNNAVRASFTVEAAFIVPIILFTIVGGFNIGFEMFQQAESAAAIHDELKELEPVEIVRRNTMIQNLADQ